MSSDALVTMREGERMRAVGTGDATGPLRIALVGPVISSGRLEDTFSADAASHTSSRELNIVGRCMNAQDTAEMASLCRTLLRLPTAPQRSAESPVDSEPPPPRFDERALAALAAASPTIYCECPRHLVGLVLRLSSFERNGVECANRGPDDSALHRDLEQTAGRARLLLEDALLLVAAIESLTIPRASAE